MTALAQIYTTSALAGAEVHCKEHRDWWVDADGTNLPDVIRAAVDHLREDHREPVDGCACRDRVYDTRCFPPINLMEMT